MAKLKIAHTIYTDGTATKVQIALFLSQGTQVGILIDPDKHTVRVYHTGGLSKNADTGESQVTTLGDGDTLTLLELFPGWEIPITSLWPVVYE